MSRKLEHFIDLSSTEYDLSEDNKDFKEWLRIEFLRAAGQGHAVPLSDDDFAGLNAAGDGGMMYDKDIISAPAPPFIKNIFKRNGGNKA